MPLAIAALLFLAAAGARADDPLAREFASPPPALQTRPLWFWNGALDKAKTTEIMERCRESGYAGFGILPAQGMTPAFMTPEFLDQYAHAVSEARRLGLKLCLYDEYWFPSGSAGGLLAKEHPEALSKRLDMLAKDIAGPARCELDLPPGTLMSAVAMQARSFRRVDLRPFVHDGKLAWDAPAGPWKVMLFTCVRDGARGLVDYLDADAVKQFIGLTYERYYARFPEAFGTTIDSAFYDEPTMHWVQGRAWTPSFNEKFRRRFGYDPAPYYPALWMDIGPETDAARNALFGFRADLYADAWGGTIQEWCRRHRVALTGHQDQEEIVNPTGLCGDLMKALSRQEIPGIDQVFAYGRASKAYKIVSSVADNWDRRLVVTECYGGISNMPVANLYKEAMDQFAKGINLMVPHAVWYDTAHVIFQPELSYRTAPYNAELPAYNRYMGRLQRLLQGGRHVADIAVLYPIATLQAGYRFDAGEPYAGGVTPPEADYMDVGEALALRVRRDYTYLHPEVLEERCTVAGPLLRLNNKVNAEQFRVLVLPGSRVISWRTLEKIRRFYDAGGVVIATTRLPDAAAEPGKNAQVRAAVAAMFGTQAPAAGPKVTASSSWAAGGYEPARAADGDLDTRWNAADQSGGGQWLEIDFGRPRTFVRTVLCEAFDRARGYHIQYWQDGKWADCAGGDRIGPEKQDTFAPVTAQKVRLYVDGLSADSLSIREFEVYDAAGRNLASAAGPLRKQTNARGGRAYFLPSPTPAALKAALDDALPVYDVQWEQDPAVSGGNLSYIHRVAGGRHFFFFANSSDTPVDGFVRLRGKLDLQQWNPHTGAVEKADAAHLRVAGQDVTRVRLVLPPVQSRFLVSRAPAGAAGNASR